jgi:hypothetical protein
MITRIPAILAEELVIETARQLKEKGYSIDQDPVYRAINTANVHPDSKRMQFRLSKGDEFDQEITGPEGKESWFFPRRILRNSTTDYRSNGLTKAIKEGEARYFSVKRRGFDSSHVCRCARTDPRILEIMQKAYSRGSLYSLMGTLGEMYDSEEEGKRVHDKNGDLYIRTPVIITPRAEPAEIKDLDSFCKQFQIPSQEKVERILGITD